MTVGERLWIRNPTADLPGAVKANLPATLAPQLATLATSVPASGEWSYEIKFDGYRLLAVKSGRWSKRATGAEHWVKPELVAEISFADWRPDGRVHQPVFQGLLSDKAVSAITRETATEASRAAAPSANRAGTVKVSHPDRIIDPSTGLRKLNRSLAPMMDERMRRCWAATEAQAYGWGGVRAVSSATGLSPSTIGS